MFKKSSEQLRQLQELRRSNAATPLRNKKKYTRQNNKKMIKLEIQKGPNETETL